MEPLKHQIRNHRKLDAIPAAELNQQWAAALDKCRKHVRIRIARRTAFGAHSSLRLGEDPITFYVTFAYEAILSGLWEWKDEYTLSQQMIRIVNSKISEEVRKFEDEEEKVPKLIAGDEIDEMFYGDDPLTGELDMVREILINKQISVIEESIHDHDDMKNFWECVKEGMTRMEIAEYMEKTPKQIGKLRERFLEKIRNSPYFNME